MNTAAGPKARVFVAVGSALPDPLTLVAATQLALVAGGKLAALFVEDISLLRLAKLPIAFEIGAALPTPRPFGAADVERGFKVQAAELRRALAEVANAVQLDFTFDIVRGKPASALLEASAEQDLIVLAGAAAGVFTHHPHASIVRNALRDGISGIRSRRVQSVAAVLQSGPSVQRVLAIARRLARANSASLILFVATNDARDAQLTTLAGKWPDEHGASARIIALPDRTPESLAKLVAQTGSQVLFWPAEGNLEMASAVEPLLAAISRPLVVVR